MTRQDLRNRTPEFKGPAKPGLWEQDIVARQRASRARRAKRALLILFLVFLALLYTNLPSECKTTKTEVPRYCVD